MSHAKLSAALLAFVLAGCASPGGTNPDPFASQPPNPSADRNLEVLVSFLEGRFDSIQQPAGAGDSTPTTLRHARAWPERTGEFWLYAEYAKRGEDDHPYRQRLYRFGRIGERFVGITYRLPGDPKRFAGDARRARPLAGVDPSRLEERTGCRVIFIPSHLAIFQGGTLGKECPGESPEVRYETSEFSLTSSSLRTWDRGFDASGKLIQGSPAGPLEMRKHAESRP